MLAGYAAVLARWPLYLSILLGLFVLWSLRSALRGGLRNVPGPLFARFSRLYIVRQIAKCRMHVLFIDLHRQYGPLVRYAPNKVSIADPAAIATIYGINSRLDKSDFYRGFTGPHPGGGILDNIFATADSSWHRTLKGAIAPTYALSNLRKMESLVDECTELFLKGMDEVSGQAIDLGTWLQWYAFDVIANLTFALPFGFLRHKEDPDAVLDSLEWANIYNTMVGQAPSLHLWLLGNHRLMDLLMKIPAVGKKNPMVKIGKMVADTMHLLETEKGDQERGTQIEYLYKMNKVNPERLPQADLYSSVLTNLFAGSDTTAMALRAIFYFLVRYPTTYSKLRDEIDLAFQQGRLSDIVEFRQGSELPYLQAVIKEAMRLHPGVSYPLERVVPAAGAHICGQFFPKGTVVGVHAWVVHRDKTIFGPDAEDFRPSRWLDSGEEQIRAMEKASIPFGAGSRICLGRHISMLEMTKFVPTILLRYDVEWAADKPEWTISGYWFAKQSDVIMRLKPRKHFKDT